MTETSLRIDKDGRWFFRGEEITHRKTYLLYARSLTRDESGQIVLRVGREQCAVEVEDAPFVVRSLEFISSAGDEGESIGLILNDESREELDPETLRIGPENVPYCKVRKGAFEARFSRNAYQLLIPRIQHDDSGSRFFLPLNGKRHFL